MNTICQQLPAIAGAILLVASTVLQTVWMRPSDQASVSNRILRTENLPQTIGDWRGTDLEIRTEDLAIAEASGSLSRRYVNRTTGKEVVMLLICGRPGPISVHPPTACYSGAGYRLLGEPRRYQAESATGAEDTTDAFFVADLRQPPPDTGSLRIFWAWSADGNWQAPDNPRFEYAGTPLLFKLYVTHDTVSERDAIVDSPAEEFIRSLLPVLRKGLFQ